MSNNELYKQAIADAKSLKEITIEKAKQQIAETFTPKIQEMFRLKVNELEEEMEEEGKNMDHGKHMEEENYSIDEATLDEILAELQQEEMEEGKHKEEEGLEEGKKMDDENLEEAESKEEEEKEDEKEEGKEEGEHEAEEVAELSVEEFKELVRDVVADVLAGNTGEEEGIEGIDGLDGIDAEEGGEDDSLSLDEILAELQEEEAIEEAKKHKGMEKHEEKHEEKEKMEEELSTALATIAELRSSINEMNLFNAKLLYSSKILESRNLSATQKAKVLKAFDAAKNTSEVKQTYKVLNEAYEAPSKKQSIKESIGFASKPMGNAPAKPIVETDAFATRMQQLAGIIKPKI
jgi:hypothetical protein